MVLIVDRNGLSSPHPPGSIRSRWTDATGFAFLSRGPEWLRADPHRALGAPRAARAGGWTRPSHSGLPVASPSSGRGLALEQQGLARASFPPPDQSDSEPISLSLPDLGAQPATEGSDVEPIPTASKSIRSMSLRLAQSSADAPLRKVGPGVLAWHAGSHVGACCLPHGRTRACRRRHS